MLPAGAAVTPQPDSAPRQRRTRRVRSEEFTTELSLFNRAGMRTDAELRIFLQDELVVQVNDGFASPELHTKISSEVKKVQGPIKHGQMEFDLNIERRQLPGEEALAGEENRDAMAARMATIAYRFDRFLRTLHQVENVDYQALLEERNMLTMRLPSAETIEKSEMPANMVEHLMEWGMEKHLEVVKKFLLGSDEALGVTVTFKDLTVTQQGPKACLGRRDSPAPSVELLKHVSGVIPAGKLTLLLGAPHSGKTQLLHALSLHTKNKGPISLTGNVFYNAHNARQVHPANFCTVVEQVDVHIPIMTVRETLEFAHRCRNRVRQSDPAKKALGKKFLSNRVDMIMAVLGLTRVADTIVGNENIKGISGGEMRRVTLGEMLVAGSKVLLLDEVSTGLDSAATFDITKSILAMCKVMNVSSVISLLQPPPETFDLFQDLILMADGNIVYHGPRADALAHVNGLGREMQREMDVADFLIETSLDRTGELLSAYKQSAAHAEMLQFDPSTAVFFEPNSSAAARDALLAQAGQFAFSYPHLLNVVFRRQLTNMMRNKPFILARLAQNIVLGLLIGALFFDIPFDQYYLVAMVLSQALSMSGFSTMALIGDVLTTRNTFYKQNRESFFPALTYVMADYLVGLPFSLMDAFLLGSITYFMGGLSTTPNGRPYFVFLVIFISFGVCMGTIIRFIGYVCPDQTMASSLAVFFNIMSMIFGGAIATPNVIPGWWIWWYWAFSPFAWAYRSLLQNEFLSDNYQSQCNDPTQCPNNEQGQCVRYCGKEQCPLPYPDELCGVYFLRARQVETDPMFTWLGAGVIWIYTLVFILLSVWALLYVRYDIKYAELSENFSALPPPTLAAAANGEEEKKKNVDVESQQQPPAQEPQEPVASSRSDRATLVWRNLFYTIDVREPSHERRMMEIDLLKGINGFAKPYEMTALMGSSGAGKTTLLDCLCYRKTMGRIKGEILLGGKQVQPKMFKKQVGYVEQFGVHNATSTVRESLEFSAKLRLPSDTADEVRFGIVGRVMSVLQIDPIANARVNTLSFEENKRLTIAVELCAKAKILFADEPTSGLTSKEANLTMSALSRVSRLGVPVICTIHQPSSEIFQKFDRLLLLKRGGEIVFFGRTKDLVPYFERIPSVGTLPEGLNPATWMLDVIGAGVGRSNNASKQFDFAELYRLSDLSQENEAELLSILESASSSAGMDQDENISMSPRKRALEQQQQLEHIPEEFNSGYAVQLKRLMKRNFQDFWRNPTYAHLRWIIILFFAFVTGTLFLQQNLATAAGVQSRVNVINLMLLLTANHNSATIVPYVFSKRALFYRERNSGMYAGFVYALAHQLVEDPYVLWQVGLSTVVFYFAVGMTATAGAFFYYVFLLFFFVLFTTFLGAAVAAGTGVQGAAMLVSSLVIQLLVIFSGVAVPGNQLAAWLLGGYYISPVRWAMEGLVVSQFLTYEDAICNPSGTVVTWNAQDAFPPAGSDCAIPTIANLTDVNKMACCNVLGNRPISAKAYTLTGWTYEDGTVTQAWLGGNNGFRTNWLGYDYLYVVMAMIIVRGIHIFLIHFVSHQKR